MERRADHQPQQKRGQARLGASDVIKPHLFCISQQDGKPRQAFRGLPEFSVPVNITSLCHRIKAAALEERETSKGGVSRVARVSYDCFAVSHLANAVSMQPGLINKSL